MHLTDDDLVLHYYGEDGVDIVAVERHLQACAHCARAYDSLSRSLNAVTPPALVEAPDDLPELRRFIRDRAAAQSPPIGLAALVWLAALAYPLSVQALFSSGRWTEDHTAGPLLVALALLWACAGPALAVLALNRTAGHGAPGVAARVRVAGALLAAIAPSLFPLVSRLNVNWYLALALASFVAIVPWPVASRSTARVQDVHRISALVLTLFVLAHVVNQALAFVSVPAYAAMRSVMRVASEQPVTFVVIVAAAAIQIATGMAMGTRQVRAGASARNLQAVSGWCLAAFLLTHVFSPLVMGPPQPVPGAAPFDQFDLLATPRAAAQLPFLLIGTAAFLFHVGVYARLAALAYLAEASVRRLSYAGAVAAATVLVTIGLSLCGIHVIR